MKTAQNQYHQPIAFHPGETLREKLEEISMTQKEFAVRVGKPEKTVIDVLNGNSSVTPDMAVQFEYVLKIPAQLWLSLQSAYDEYVVREHRTRQLKTTTTNGMMTIPTFEIVEDQFDPGGRRKFFDVYVNGKKVSSFPYLKSAEEWIQNTKRMIGIVDDSKPDDTEDNWDDWGESDFDIDPNFGAK